MVLTRVIPVKVWSRAAVRAGRGFRQPCNPDETYEIFLQH